MYKRFLNNNDYLSIITQEALDMITRGDDERYLQAEEAAEASIIDYLSDKYEVEKELALGKGIMNYDRRMTYPVGSFFYNNGVICEVIKTINGYKSPSDKIYWEPTDDSSLDINNVSQYYQQATYQIGDIVKFSGVIYKCINENGYGFLNIRIPGVRAWETVLTYEWQNIKYNLWEVVSYKGKFFTLTSLDGYDNLVDPMTSKNWGMIGNYDSSLDTYSNSLTEYVVYNNKVYYPVMNVNADAPIKSDNYQINDPRNFNLKKHMLHLAIYELHKLISPNNVSNLRINDYNSSIQWLKDASTFKLNPQIERKIDKTENLPITDWQMTTFQASFDVSKNSWFI